MSTPYFGCPICGKHTVLNSNLKGKIKFGNWTPYRTSARGPWSKDTHPIIIIKEREGKKGFFIKEEINFETAIANPEYRDYLLDMIEQLKKVSDSLIEKE